tara:strand:- start:685 stop:1107 length:423 start_codon:yes stop_codon:yes gene_type:complete
MIKYNIRCHNDHEFESWFSDSQEFDNLNKKKLLECIFCNSKIIVKSIMSPRISGTKEKHNNINASDEISKSEKNKLLQLRKFVENNFEYVGENFSKKVREIYYDKRSKKTIYGTATSEERNELEEEGIDLLSIPWVSKDN